jgi:hypothetical protein
MSTAELALHVASIPGNVTRLAQADGFDVAPTSYASPSDTAALMDTFDRSVSSLRDWLTHLDDAAAVAQWRLRFRKRGIATWT